ncbi:MAG TPA: cyclase family protein [Gemmatimonadaceae bacterium]|nr:cyclase family protein [Gemmatimonadaceae bacterium]
MLRDISVALGPATPEWPGDTRFSCLWTWSMRDGASVNVSSIHTSPHVGTHADAPLHVRDGWTASHELPLDAFSGRALVCTVRGGAEEVGLAELGGLAGAGRVERLLLRTGRGIAGMHFPDTWPTLAPAAVRALLARGLVLLGVDAPSVDPRESKTLEVHRLLFEGGANVLENLDLRDVPEGEYELIAYPIKVHGLDAAPVRAVLRDLQPSH